MAYIGSSPTKVVSRQSANIFTYTVSVANTTVFSGADDNGNTLACTPSDIMVHMNGIKLEESDYTASTTTVTLGSGTAAGDEVTITAFVTFESADHYNKSTADTRYVNTTGDTMTGNLGVGGAANGTYAITSHSSGGANLRLENDGEVGFIRLEDDGDLNIWAHGDENISFLTGTGSGTTRMNIDGSGHVTMPNQPLFCYMGTKSHTISTTGAQTMSSSNVWSSSVNYNHNSGSHFDPSTGRFTAPVAGAYQFIFQCTASGFGSGYLWFYMNINTSTYSYMQMSQQSEHSAIIHSAIFNLSANDYVTCSWTNNYVSGTINYPQFSGFLIG